jgi:hypothetical protein
VNGLADEARRHGVAGRAPEGRHRLDGGDAAIRADRKADGDKAWRKPYGSND